MRLQKFLPLGTFVAATVIAGCGSNNASSGPMVNNATTGGTTAATSAGGAHTGGANNLGGATGNVGGTTSAVGGGTGVSTTGGASGTVTTGGTTGTVTTGGSTGTVTTGGTTGVVSTGGTSGVTNTGGNTSTVSTGGTTGAVATGGTTGTVTTGGTTGAVSAGGSTGNVTTGGTKATTGGAGTTSTGGTGTAATGGTQAATGGTPAATGGATSTAVTPAAPACPSGNNSEGVPNAANPATADVISDFNTLGDTATYPCIPDPNHPENPCTDNHLIVYKTGTRGGTLWYPYTDYQDDPNCNASTQKCTSKAASLPTLSWDSGTDSQGTCTPGGSLKAVGTGVSSNSGNGGQWGSGIGVDLMARNSSNQKVPYDASAYTGIGFNMKCASDVGYVYFKLIDALNDGDCSTGSCGISSVCVYSGGTPLCNQYGYKNSWITTNWANYELYFADALQDPNVNQFGSGVDKSKLTALQIQFNTGYDTSGSNKVATSFTCWVDDVHFLKSNPPAPQTTCASGAYTTSGNKIMCGSTQKIFRGVARPSMEWDTSGWNVMPWDMQRIKNGWKANLVRIGLNQDYYMGTSTASTASIYPKNVARAVRWAEAAGMDVILDLHWINETDGTSTSGIMASTATNSDKFWTAVAGAFKSDNQVMFELYNEPTLGGASPAASDWATWKTNMTALYGAVRGAGANQITIIGGLNWAYDLSNITTSTTNRISGTNIVYNTHPYGNKAPSSDWPAKFGTLAASLPVMATEFGDNGNNGGTCAGAWTQSLITYMEGLGMSWTAWGWYAGGGCAFPSLISSYDGTTLDGTGSNADASRSVMMAKN